MYLTHLMKNATVQIQNSLPKRLSVKQIVPFPRQGEMLLAPG